MLCCRAPAEERKPKQSRFYCCGVVPHLYENCGRHSLFEVRHGMVWPCARKSDVGVEIAKEAEEIGNSFGVHKVNDPDVPYVGDIPDSLYVGKAIQICGSVTEDADRFIINLLSGKPESRNVCFHFNPRFDRHVVVRNTRRKASWGQEEIAAGRSFPFTAGKNFVITIFVADSKFLVAIDNVHFCGYSFRIPVEQVTLLQILGDVSLKFILFHNSDNYPTPVPSRIPRVIVPKTVGGSHPLIQRKSLLNPGSSVDIKGRVKLLPQGFYINLQVGSTIVPHAEIPFHMNLRLCRPGLRENQMIFNSWHCGKWDEELRPSECPFSPGMKFKLKILYLKEGFHVSVNDEYLLAFPLRVSEPPQIDTIRVEGDVIITKVKTKATKLVTVTS